MIAHAFCEDVSSDNSQKMNVEGTTLSRLFSEMSIALNHGATLLLVGETGTGKSFLSQLLHHQKATKRKRFLSLNCGVLTAGQIEQQIFSRLSNQNNEESELLLIREIETLSWSQQVQFLNQIEEKKGDDSNCRLIVSCQHDLLPFVEQGIFRADLYYHLNAHRFEIPPLRHRLDEITGLARQFIRHYAKQFNRRIDRIEDSMIKRLMAHPWSGNIRELKHVIERSVMYCDTGILNETHLPESLKSVEQSDMMNASRLPKEISEESLSPHCDLTLEEQLANTERKLVEQALIRNQQCRTDAARELGVSRVTLYNKMKKLGLETLKSAE